MIEEIIQTLKRIFNPPRFIIRIHDGNMVMEKGKVVKKFLDECTELSKSNGENSGKIFGVESEYGLRLEFSNNIPENIQQRFRNIWGIYK